MDVKETGWEDLTHLVQNNNQWWVLVNTVLNLEVP